MNASNAKGAEHSTFDLAFLAFIIGGILGIRHSWHLSLVAFLAFVIPGIEH